MEILGLLGMYFDAAVVFITNSLLLFSFALAILWPLSWYLKKLNGPYLLQNSYGVIV